ncbi:iron transporter [Blastococcus goldschmidtiae]|uniref:Iron transporter n=1 Tax=Blastococcus goldschmidtiae TaxID=3075546 RepID=A0ABU2K7I7_9ACTN|nr:iron transporter [Blastococcus sp. DSM 46792]MDT0276139.1 iron transporter [Blastococcus sp. DSM 46792]
MAAGHAVEDRTTPAAAPPMEKSNEAEPDQLDVARRQGDAYGAAVQAMAEEDGAAHIEVAVADLADGRFVPGLDVTVTVQDGDRELFSQQAPFLWHPFLHHYGFNAKVPGEGPFTVAVRIEPPSWMRHDPRNGKRYADPVDVVFADVGFEPGRKPSPEASPRGPETPCAG